MIDEKAELALALSKHSHRMMAAGVPYSEIESVRQRAPDTWVEWFDYWADRGSFSGELAEEAAAQGDQVTASAHWSRCALYHHFAQFMLYGHPEEKARAQSAKVEAYRKAASQFRPPAAFLQVPSPQGAVPVVLRKPSAPRPGPCVVLIPGLEATKEELHGWEPYFLDRQLATAVIDGPGQGELAHVALDPDEYVTAVSGVIDRLVEDPEIDSARIGIMGVSLGGLLASMVAAKDHRLAAAVEVGGTFDTESRWERANSLSRRGHQHITHSRSEEETRAKVAKWSMASRADQITCEFLVVHGELDAIVPLDQAEAYAKHVMGATLAVVPGGNHVCNNLAHLVRPLVADWLNHAMTGMGVGT